MCFSTEASFSAGALLTTVGVASWLKSSTTPQRVLSCIPLLFGAQQLSEGFVWLSLTHEQLAHWERPATLAFLFFAMVLWPILAPTAVWLLEPEGKRKAWLGVLVGLGGILAAYLGYCLSQFHVQANLDCRHVQYDLNFPEALNPISGPLYFVVTVLPPLMSSLRRVRLQGVAVVFAYVLAKEFFDHYVISVWCFFAAVVSTMVLLTIRHWNQRPSGVVPA
jgi:hypothetical protein